MIVREGCWRCYAPGGAHYAECPYWDRPWTLRERVAIRLRAAAWRLGWRA